jgi:hypothetical protein
MQNSKRGLANADQETRERVASAGGQARGESRQNEQNNSSGGNSKRGLASADKETRERVASAGGRASGESRRQGQ